MISITARQLRAERQKIRHTKALLVPLGFLGFEILWTMWQLSSMKPSELSQGYLMLFYNLPVMNTLLMPLMISVIASRVCDMEVKGDTLKILYTMQKQESFFDFKYLNCLRYITVFVIGQGLMILFFGTVNHLGTIRPSIFFIYLITTFAVSTVVLSIQQTLSLMSHSQLLPLGIGIGGSFLGLFSLFFPKPVARLVLWGYYANFSVVGMNWDPDTRIIDYYVLSFPLSRFLLFLAAGVFIYFICRMIVVKKEV